MAKLKKEYISNLDNSIKEANETFNLKFKEMEKEISEVEKFFLGKEELKDVIAIGEKLLNSDVKEYVKFVQYEVRGDGISHHLGFDIGWDDRDDLKINGLTQQGGGFCGDWKINIDKNGKITYEDEFDQPEKLDMLDKKLSKVSRLIEEYDEFIEKINDFLEKLPKGCLITTKKEETKKVNKSDYDRDDYTIYLAPKKPDKVKFSKDWQTDEVCRRYCDIEKIFKSFNVKSPSELISKLKNEELFREIVEFFSVEGNLELLFRQANLGINYKTYAKNILLESPRLENPIGEKIYNDLQNYLKERSEITNDR